MNLNFFSIHVKIHLQPNRKKKFKENYRYFTQTVPQCDPGHPITNPSCGAPVEMNPLI